MTTTKQGAYIGDGTFIPDVPARQLSREEWDQFGSKIEQYEKASGLALYNPYHPPTAEEKKADASANTGGGK